MSAAPVTLINPELISELAQACVNSDLEQLKAIISNHNINNKVNPFNFDFNLQSIHPIPDDVYNSGLLQPSTNNDNGTNDEVNSLLDAAVLSNSPPIIDLVIETFFNNYVCNDTDKRGHYAFKLGVLMNKMDSISHLLTKVDFFAISLEDVKSILEYLVEHRKTLMLIDFMSTYSKFGKYEMERLKYNFLLNSIGNNDRDLITYLINEVKFSIEMQPGTNRPVIYQVVEKFQWEMAKFLITNFDLDISMRYSSLRGIDWYQGTALHYVLMDPNIDQDTIDFFINEVGITVNPVIEYDYRNNSDIYSPLGAAVQHNNIPMIKYLIERYGADVNYKTPKSKYSLIHIAAHSEHSTMELYEYLLTLGIETQIVSIPNVSRYSYNSKNSILNFAVQHQPLEVIKFLLQQFELGVNLVRDTIGGVGFAFQSNNDLCTLSQATSNPDPTVLDYLIDITDFQHFFELYNTTPNQCLSDFKQRHVENLLVEAVRRGNLPVLKLLAGEKYKIDITQQFSQSRYTNILEYCLNYSRTEAKTSQIFRHLVGLNLFDLSKKKAKPILHAAVQNPSLNLDDIKFLCTRPGVDVHQVDENGQNISHLVQPMRENADEFFSFFISMLSSLLIFFQV
jgi:hypothetical protein